MHHAPVFCRLAVALLLTTMLFGCISIESTGQSSRKTKKAVTQSASYKLSELLYPIAASEQSEARQAKRRVKELDRQLESAVAQLLAEYGSQIEALSTNMDVPLQAVGKVRVQVTDEGQPVVFVDTGRTIHVDLEVARGFFAGSLVEGMQGRDFFGRPKSDLGPDPTDPELLEAFLELRARIDAQRGRTLLGDIFSDDPFAMSEFAEDLDRVDSRYRGTFYFLLAHELGHLALGHFDSGWDRAVRDTELQADAFAVRLMVSALRPLIARDAILGDSEFFTGGITTNLLGYLDLFRYGYQRAGFVSGDVPEDAYPTATERLAQSREVFEAAAGPIRQAAGSAWERAMERAWEEALRKLEKSSEGL